ncbi:MAG TPA: MFS transporter [Burkholderiales bacterium]|nr:MFS transporter [Burkholderiales bacterium]
MLTDPIQWFGRRGIYYGWVIVAVTFLTLFIATGFRFAFGVYYSAIVDETGWGRAETAGIVSAAMIVYACTAALSGYLFDRVGARVLFPIGALCMGAGLMLCSTATSLAGLTATYGILLGFSYAALGFIPHMAIVPRWFDRRRGLASALSLAGNGLGSLVIASLSAELIVHVGWREAMWWFGIVAMVVLIPVTVVFHRHSAERVGLVRDGASARAAARAAPATGTTLHDALRSRHFWQLALAVTAMGTATMTIVVHQTRMLVDMGYGLTLASLIFGVLGALRAFGGLIWGALSDRIGRSACVAVICGISLVGLALLWLASFVPPESAGLRIALLAGYLLMFGLGFNGMSPVYASAVSDRFSGRNLGTILGLLDLGFGLGSAAGPWWAGWMFDRYVSYTGVIVGVAAGVVVACLALWSASRRYPRSMPAAPAGTS